MNCGNDEVAALAPLVSVVEVRMLEAKADNVAARQKIARVGKVINVVCIMGQVITVLLFCLAIVGIVAPRPWTAARGPSRASPPG